MEAAVGGLSYGRALSLVAGGAIAVVAVFAALSQLQIAPAIVNGLFFALLAIIVGSSVVAIGGGGIKTMQRYWDRAAQRVEQESTQIRQQAQGSTERIKQRAQDRKEQMQPDPTGVGARAAGASGGDGSGSGNLGDALRRDWEQTKEDVPGLQGSELNQDVRDTLRQASGQQQTPPPDAPNPGA